MGKTGAHVSAVWVWVGVWCMGVGVGVWVGVCGVAFLAVSAIL